MYPIVQSADQIAEVLSTATLDSNERVDNGTLKPASTRFAVRMKPSMGGISSGNTHERRELGVGELVYCTEILLIAVLHGDPDVTLA